MLGVATLILSLDCIQPAKLEAGDGRGRGREVNY